MSLSPFRRRRKKDDRAFDVDSRFQKQLHHPWSWRMPWPGSSDPTSLSVPPLGGSTMHILNAAAPLALAWSLHHLTVGWCTVTTSIFHTISAKTYFIIIFFVPRKIVCY
jgi:hypothetical protein